METPKSVKIELIANIIDDLRNGVGNGVYGCDLHNEIFNTYYYIIGYAEASKWLKRHEIDAFEVIDFVLNYEIDMFGVTNTKVNSESIVNMYVYIVGEEIFSELNSLSDLMDDRLTDSDIETIIQELENILEGYK